MKAVITHLRHLRHCILAYLDDFIGLAKQGNQTLRKVFLKLLKKLGLHISVEKSSLELEKKKEFLDLLVSTEGKAMFFVLLKKKIKTAKEITKDASDWAGELHWNRSQQEGSGLQTC